MTGTEKDLRRVTDHIFWVKPSCHRLLMVWLQGLPPLLVWICLQETQRRGAVFHVRRILFASLIGLSLEAENWAYSNWLEESALPTSIKKGGRSRKASVEKSHGLRIFARRFMMRVHLRIAVVLPKVARYDRGWRNEVRIRRAHKRGLHTLR